MNPAAQTATKDDVQELAPGFWSLGQQLGGKVHAFLCDDGSGELTLVDSLFDTDGARILRLIERIGHRPEQLRHIVITHGHRSHLGGMARLKELSGATLYAHEWEADILQGERKAQPVSLVPGRPFRAYVPLQLGLALGVGKHPPAKVDHFVTGGDRIGPLELLDASGHSPGHLGFAWHERKALIAGDAIATWPGLMAGWPAFNLNAKQHRAALRRLAEIDAEVCGVGHGPPITARARERVRDVVDAVGA
jgi:glyoxylase-like metal-dependent hydrolase (beta-lactamase superfamily II)